MQGGQISTQVAAATAQIGGQTAVPEPTSIGLLIAGSAGLLGRRRRGLLSEHRSRIGTQQS
jgi:hypothetical protein